MSEHPRRKRERKNNVNQRTKRTKRTKKNETDVGHLLHEKISHKTSTPSTFKRTLRSSRSTDAKTSETPVVDDVPQPPPNSSPGEPQQQRV